MKLMDGDQSWNEWSCWGEGSWLSQDVRMTGLAAAHCSFLWWVVMCQDRHQPSLCVSVCPLARRHKSSNILIQVKRSGTAGSGMVWLQLQCLQASFRGNCDTAVPSSRFCSRKTNKQITSKLQSSVPTWPSALSQHNWWVLSDNPLRHG